MKTFSARLNQIDRTWFIINADNKTLGRLSTQISYFLQGKHKPEYTRNIDTGDYIIVINAKNIKVTGNKNTDKIYYHHTGYIGGIKSIHFNDLLKKHPERIIEKAVKGMLPKNSLGRQMYKKLKIYSDDNHKHASQNPILLNI